jgi:hypothetical protein
MRRLADSLHRDDWSEPSRWLDVTLAVAERFRTRRAATTEARAEEGAA